MRISLAPLVFACFAAAAGQPAAKQYTPEIHGVLANTKQTAPLNVCLRQSGSQIRACGYTDASGHFFIPSSGPLHSAQAKSDGENADVIPSYWLETGRVDAAQKLWLIDPVSDRFSAIELECDLARAARADNVYRACESKSSKAMFATAPRDDTPYRMARSAKHPAK